MDVVKQINKDVQVNVADVEQQRLDAVIVENTADVVPIDAEKRRTAVEVFLSVVDNTS